MTDLFGSNPADPQPAPVTPAATPEPAPAAAPAPAPAPDPNALFVDQLAGIQADDGRQKYADVQTALASIPHAQEHIKSQVDRIAELEAELAKKEGMEEVLQRMQPQTPSETPSQGMDESKVAELLNAQLNLREQSAKEAGNKAAVINALTEKYGSKAEEMYLEKAKQLGVEESFLTGMAGKAPQTVLAYFDGVKASVSNPTTPGFTAPLSTPAEPVKDYMSIFKAGESESIKKWRSAAKPE